jgi:hypothetical protein
MLKQACYSLDQDVFDGKAAFAQKVKRTLMLFASCKFLRLWYT